MQKIFKAIKLAILILIIAVGISAAKPYWDRHWLKQEVETAAVYGTKHSVKDTKKYLDRKMAEKGNDFRGKDFRLKKGKDGSMTISITYRDEIRFFGISLKQLKFTVKETAFEVEERF